MGVTELESVTSTMSSERSNQLSYTPGKAVGRRLLAVGQARKPDPPSVAKAIRLIAALYDSKRRLRQTGAAVFVGFAGYRCASRSFATLRSLPLAA